MITNTHTLSAAGLLIFTLLVAGHGEAPLAAQPNDQAEAAARPVDQYGDPLPRHAMARMGTLRWRHGGPVYFVGYTSGGRHLLTASADGHFRVWDLASGKEVRRFGKATAPAKVAAGGIVINGNAMVTMSSQIVRGVDLTADGKILAVANQDGTIHLYDVERGQEIRSFRNSRGAVMGLTFSPDGKTLVAKGTDQQLARWETASGKELPRIGSPPDPKRRIYFGGGQGNTIAFSADGKLLASTAMQIDNNRAVGLVQVYDADTGNEIRSIKGPANSYAQSLVFAGKLLGWAGTDGTVRFYEAETGKEVRTLGRVQNGRYFSALVLSPDGKTLAGRLINSTGIQLWDVASGKEIKTLGEEAPAGVNILVRSVGVQGASSIAFSPDGQTLAEGLPSNTIRLWEVASGKEILPVVGHQGGVTNLGVPADGKTVVTRGTDNSVRTWDLATGKELRSFKLPNAGNADLSADGKIVVFGGLNNTVHIWDAEQGKELRAVPLQGPQQFGNVAAGMGGLAVSPNGRIAAVRGFDQVVYLIETATGRLLPPLADAQPNQNGIVIINGNVSRNAPVFTFSPDGSLLATVGLLQRAVVPGQPVVPAQRNPMGVIQLWSTTTGRLTRRFESTQRAVTDLVFSPDGQTLATANTDQTISIWEVATGKELFSFKTSQPVLNAQAQQQRLAMGYPASGSVALAFSADGRFLALGGTDNIIRVHDVRNGQELARFAGHEGAILTLAFARDGQTLLSGSNDTTALAWDGGAMLAAAARPAVDLNEQQVQELWDDLASSEGPRIYRAITTLSAAPRQTVPLFKERLKPEPGVAEATIDALLKDLESNDFNVRQAATDELEKLGPLAEPALKKLRDGQPALETRQRVEKLLQRLETGAEPPAEQLRAIRAIRILEWLGTAEARAILDQLAGGAPGARLTVDAQEAVERLSKRNQ